MYFPLLLALLWAGIICGQEDVGTDSQEPRKQPHYTNDRPIQRDQRWRQVIAGKAGPMGPMGPPGEVDYVAVNGTIKKYVKEISRRRLLKIRLAVDENSEEMRNFTEISGGELSRIRLAMEGNRAEIQNLEGVSDQTKRQVTQLRPAVEKCSRDMEAMKAEIKKLQNVVDIMKMEDTLYSTGKRYIALASEKVSKAKAEAKCRMLGGYLANVYSRFDMDRIMKYIRKKMDISSFEDFHLGMTYSDRVLRFRDGSRASISNYKWYPGRPFNVPKYAGGNHMIIRVRRESSSANQYLMNYPFTSEYALCEI